MNPGPTCTVFAGRCCGLSNDASHNARCYCQIERYIDQNMMSHALEYKDSCSKAKGIAFFLNSIEERESLVDLFNKLGGTEWRNNS